MNHDLLSARDAEKLLGIPSTTVRSWHHRRGRTGLQSVGVNRSGHALFHREDLIALRDKHRLKVPVLTVDGGELGRHLTASDAERALGIPASRIRVWHHRRQTTGLFPGGLDGGDRPWFYEADLISLARGLRVRDATGRRVRGMGELG